MKEPTTLRYRQFCAARANAGYRPSAFCHALGITDSYMITLAKGKRALTPEMAAKMRALLGDNGFEFAIGEAPALYAPTDEAAA